MSETSHSKRFNSQLPEDFQNAFSPKDHVNNYKLFLMEALEHLYIVRKYKELNLCENCRNVNTSTCTKCSTIYSDKQFQKAGDTMNQILFEKNMQSVLLSSNCNSSSNTNQNCSKHDSSKSFIEQNNENVNIQNLMLNNNKQSPFEILTKQINKNSQNSHFHNVENSLSEKVNLNTTRQNHEKNSAHILHNKKKVQCDSKKNFKKITRDKKKNSLKNSEKKSTKSIVLKESIKILKAESYDQSTVDSKQEEEEISNFACNSYTCESNNTKEVICKFRESACQYWVMDINDLENYQKIEVSLSTGCKIYENVNKPDINVLYGCLFENNYYRGRIVSLCPKIIVHFVDFGKTCIYDSEFKKLPEALQKAPGLVYQINLKENSSECYLTQNLEKRKLLIKIFEMSSSGNPVVEILKDSEFINLETEKEKSCEINYSVNEKAVEKLALISSETEIQEMYVADTIQKGSEGIILLMPGRGKIRFASIIPDNDVDAKSCSEKIMNFSSSQLTPIEANEGDYVIVSNIDKNSQRGKVLCKLGSSYYVFLIDCGTIICTNKLYSLSDSMKNHKALGVVITLQEIFSEETLGKIDVCYYSVIEKKEKGKLLCRLKSAEKDDLLANVIIERPSHKRNVISLKSKCFVEISSPGIGNTLYVRELDESSGWKLMELNKKINLFCETVPDLTSVPRIGDLCSAKFKNDQKYYRGLVKSISNNKIEILFVDFGNSQFFDICSDSSSHICVKDLKHLPLGLQAIPFFAVQVSLANVSHQTFSLKAKTYLQKLILDSTELVLTYQNFSQGVFLKEKLSDVVVNDILNDICSDIEKTSFLSNNDTFMGDKMKYTIFSVGSKCDMVLLYVNEKEFEESKSFWCADALSENFKYINSKLNSEISSYCNTCVDPYRPSEHELCLAEFEGVWYRALALDADNDNFIVFFPDFGNICELTSKSLRKIKKEFIEPPALAVNCTIIDPERLNSQPELLQRVLEILKNWMNTYTLKVEICKYENETFYLRIPEIEAIF